jgi:Fe-S-cluster-containing hydrogenase component 2
MGKPKVKVDEKECMACGGCISVCPQNAISLYGGIAFVLEEKCICCGICITTYPIGAISEED